MARKRSGANRRASAAQRANSKLPKKVSIFSATRLCEICSEVWARVRSAATTPSHLATGVEAEAASKPYEFGDTINLDVNTTLLSAIQREGLISVR